MGNFNLLSRRQLTAFTTLKSFLKQMTKSIFGNIQFPACKPSKNYICWGKFLMLHLYVNIVLIAATRKHFKERLPPTKIFVGFIFKD